MPFLVEEFDTNRIFVRAPTTVILLCGGASPAELSGPPQSLRDAFWKIINFPPTDGKMVLKAEQVTQLFDFSRYYNNLLDFETHLAQVVELIILFCESGGSLAELGAFCVTDEIAKRLFVVVRESYAQEMSFVMLGPLRKLKDEYGHTSQFTLDEQAVNFSENNPDKIDKDALKKLLTDPISERLSGNKEPTTFDTNRSGHIIKLIVGLAQEYGALRADEIQNLLVHFGVHISPESLNQYLLCAKSLEWLQQIPKGTYEYFLPGKDLKQEAATIHLKENAVERDRTRRKFKIREHWKTSDPLRFQAITHQQRKVGT